MPQQLWSTDNKYKTVQECSLTYNQTRKYFSHNCVLFIYSQCCVFGSVSSGHFYGLQYEKYLTMTACFPSRSRVWINSSEISIIIIFIFTYISIFIVIYHFQLKSFCTGDSCSFIQDVCFLCVSYLAILMTLKTLILSLLVSSIHDKSLMQALLNERK